MEIKIPPPLGMAIFPRPLKVVGRGWGKNTTGWGRDGFRLFRLTPPRPAPPLLIPTPSHVAKGYNYKFFIPVPTPYAVAIVNFMEIKIPPLQGWQFFPAPQR